MTPFDSVLRDALRSRLLRRIGNAVQHDMKSPVQGLYWCLDLVERGLAAMPPGDPARAQIEKASGLARKEIARLESTSRTFLSDAGILDDEASRFDLAELTRELTRHFATEAAMRNVQLVVSVPEVPVFVPGGRAAISQAMLASLVTALDGVPDGASVEVTLRVEGTLALLEVIDDTPATQAAAAADDEYTLASIGLRIARQNVEASGGAFHYAAPGPARRVTRLQLPLQPDAA